MCPLGSKLANGRSISPTIRFPWEFLEISWKLFTTIWGKSVENRFWSRKKFDQIQSPNVRGWRGCTITKGKDLGGAITILSFGERSDRIIKNPDPWTMAENFEDPQTPLRFIQVQSPESIGGFWIFLVQVQCVRKLEWFAQVLNSTWSLQQKKSLRIGESSQLVSDFHNPGERKSPNWGCSTTPHGRFFMA